MAKTFLYVITNSINKLIKKQNLFLRYQYNNWNFMTSALVCLCLIVITGLILEVQLTPIASPYIDYANAYFVPFTEFNSLIRIVHRNLLPLFKWFMLLHVLDLVSMRVEYFRELPHHYFFWFIPLTIALVTEANADLGRYWSMYNISFTGWETVGFLFIHWLPAIIAFFYCYITWVNQNIQKQKKIIFLILMTTNIISHSIVWVLTFIFAYILIPVFF